jgi:hypothetical protein
LLFAALAFAPSPGRAFDLALVSLRQRAGSLIVDVRLSEPLPARIRESLSRAMPATLVFHAELWRERIGWFDRLEGGSDVTMRLRYDPACDDYRLERRGAPAIAAPTVDSLEIALSRPFALTVAEMEALDPGRRYYVAVAATLKPVSIEDAEEIDEVIFPDAGARQGPGLGLITGVPRAIFDAVRNIAGLGDQRARAMSETFGTANLRER